MKKVSQDLVTVNRTKIAPELRRTSDELQVLFDGQARLLRTRAAVNHEIDERGVRNLLRVLVAIAFAD